MVTVTFSHQGELDTNVSLAAPAVGEVVELGVLTAATAPPAAEARIKAAMTRNTFVLLRARRSGDLIAAAT
jgi:hypothetical protein